MPNYDSHTLVTFGGQLREQAGEDEIWQCGIRGVDVAGQPIVPSQFSNFLATIGSFDSGIPQWFQSAASWNMNTATMTWIKVANIGPDGKYTADPKTLPVAATGGASTNLGTSPSFCSVALSWRTSAFGKRNRNGRIYPPNYVPVNAGTSTIASSTQNALAQAAKNLITALNVDGDQYSFRAGIFSAQGGHANISSVRVGNVMDVQRRRKNAVQETYVSLNI